MAMHLSSISIYDRAMTQALTQSEAVAYESARFRFEIPPDRRPWLVTNKATDETITIELPEAKEAVARAMSHCQAAGLDRAIRKADEFLARLFVKYPVLRDWHADPL